MLCFVVLDDGVEIDETVPYNFVSFDYIVVHHEQLQTSAIVFVAAIDVEFEIRIELRIIASFFSNFCQLGLVGNLYLDVGIHGHNCVGVSLQVAVEYRDFQTSTTCVDSQNLVAWTLARSTPHLSFILQYFIDPISYSIVPMDNKRYPLPPFTQQTAKIKVQAAEDAWNTKDPNLVVKAYTQDSEWRNRDIFLKGHEEIKSFLEKKWAKQNGYKLKKQLWCCAGNRIAVRFEYEFFDSEGQWWRAYGNQNWEFDENGFMAKRYASINDLKIEQKDRKFK